MNLQVIQNHTPKDRRQEERIQVVLTVISDGPEEMGFRPFVRRSLHPTGIYEYTCEGSDSHIFIARSYQEARQRIAMIKENVARMFRVWMASKNEVRHPEIFTETLELIRIG